MSRFADTLVPPRLGEPFRRLVLSSWVTNLGDGIALAAGPLLVASQTHDPFLVALAGLLQRLPYLLFGLFAGALADRVSRKAIVVTGDLLRCVVLVCLSLMIVTGNVSVTGVLVVMFLLGRAETFARALSDAEFSISGHIVADACVDEWRMTTGTGDGAREDGRNPVTDVVALRLSILTIEDW